MMTGQEKRLAIRASGVSEFVIETTLVREQQQQLRDAITQKQQKDRGFFLYPSSARAVAFTRRVFHVLAKELVLSGESLYVAPLRNYMKALLETDGDWLARAESAKMIFVSDFFERGYSKSPYAEEKTYEFVYWCKDMASQGKLISLQADTPLLECHWWPEPFLHLIEDTVSPYVVGMPTK